MLRYLLGRNGQLPNLTKVTNSCPYVYFIAAVFIRCQGSWEKTTRMRANFEFAASKNKHDRMVQLLMKYCVAVSRKDSEAL